MPNFDNKSIQGIIDKIHAELACLGEISNKAIMAIVDKAMAAGASINDISIQGIIDQLGSFSCAPIINDYRAAWFVMHGGPANTVSTTMWGSWISMGDSGIGGRYAKYSFSGASNPYPESTVTMSAPSTASDPRGYAVSVRTISYSSLGASTRAFAFVHTTRTADGAYILAKGELKNPGGSGFAQSGVMSLIHYNVPSSTVPLDGFAIYPGAISAASALASVVGYNGLGSIAPIPVNTGVRPIICSSPADSATIDTSMPVIHPQTPQLLKTVARTLPENSPSISSATGMLLQSADPTGNTYINSAANDYKAWYSRFGNSEGMDRGLIVFYFMSV